MNPISTSVVFSFADSDESADLQLENWNGFVGMGSVALALVDKGKVGDLMLYASLGTIQDMGYTATKPIPASFVEVNDSNKVTIPLEAKYEVMFALDANGIPMGTPMEVQRSGDTVTFDSKFFGLVRVKAYNKSFKVLKYTPVTTMTSATYGVVAAYRNGRMSLCHVQPPTLGTGNDELEVYRIESEMLINGDGEWEKPNGWPDNPTYPNGATPPRPRIGVISTRVHEVGMVTATGYFYSQKKKENYSLSTK